MADSKVEENAMDKLSAAHNYFGLKLHVLLSGKGGNVFFSPFSISVALSMLYRGTKAESASELVQVLGFELAKLNEQEIHNSYKQLLDILLESQDSYILAITNAIFSQKNFDLLPEYKTDLQKIYRALSMEVDFCKDSTNVVKQINSWVSENTKGKIPSVFDSLEPDTVIVLVNVIYFKGTWEHQFNKAATYDGEFFNYGREAQMKIVPLMYLKKKLYIVEEDGYKALELSYKGGDIAMLLLLPTERNGLAALESGLTASFIKDIRRKLVETTVHVTIPKLHLEFGKELKPDLKELGIHAVFGRSANLKSLSKLDGLYVSHVVHKAVLDMNEEGSEAAAVTAVAINKRCLRIERFVEFKADHPFLFVIYLKRSNMILFMGRVEEL